MTLILQRSADFAAFWTDYRLATLTTRRPDGTPHVVPVGTTLDVDRSLVRVICSGDSRKAVHLIRDPGQVVAVCQVDGGRWSTLQGPAVVREDPEAVADAVSRYAARYRQPRENPRRVVIEITVDRVLGMA